MRQKSDVMVVIGTLMIGGAELHVASVVPRLTKSGWRICIYALNGQGPLAAELARNSIEVISPPMLFAGNPSLSRRLLRLMFTSVHLFWTYWRCRPRIVHFFLPASYLIGGPLSILAGIKLRVMSRRSLNNYQAKRPILGRLERLLHPYMTIIIGNSQRVVSQLENEEKVPLQKLRLNYNGLDLALFEGHPRDAVRSALNLLDGAFVIVIVANLIAYKGHADLLAALGNVKAEMPREWRLVAIGRDDGVGDALRRQAEELGIRDHVIFAGQRRDTAAILSCADLGVLSSHEEGFSNALLEKMAAGLAVVATDVGGNAEAVRNHETGYIVPACDPPALGRAILALANDSQLRSRMGAAGRKRVESEFTIARCVGRYDELYREILSAQKKS